MMEQIKGKALITAMLFVLMLLPASAAEEYRDMRTYRAVEGEVYHVLYEVSWQDREGGSYLFCRLDGQKMIREWYVDFLNSGDTLNYPWPENCFIRFPERIPGLVSGPEDNNWLLRQNAALMPRDSGEDIEVLDALKDGSLTDAVQLIENLDALFSAPIMTGKGLTWNHRWNYDTENQDLRLSVSLDTPYGSAAKWSLQYSRNPETGDVDGMEIGCYNIYLFNYEEPPAGAGYIFHQTEPLKENFNQLFLYPLYLCLNVYYTAERDWYTLVYPDGKLKFSVGESGGSDGYRFYLE